MKIQGDDGGFRGVHLEQWRDHFYSKHPGDSADAKRKAFQRVRRDLVDGGYMTATDDVYLIRDAGLQMSILLQRDKRDIAGQIGKCPGAEAGNSVSVF
ncbi:MAG: hypothetical protein JJU08_11835 [Rhodobacteraceae bacterium]|nr:hypothetical protein [Paracoccaceae bacterium]